MEEDMREPATNFLEVFIKEEVNDEIDFLSPTVRQQESTSELPQVLLSPTDEYKVNDTEDNFDGLKQTTIDEDSPYQDEPEDLTLPSKEIDYSSALVNYQTHWNISSTLPGGSSSHILHSAKHQAIYGCEPATSNSLANELTHPFQCELCLKRFTYKWVFKMHHRTHTGEKPFECQTCGKKFAQKSNLTTHNRTHTGERLHACETCGKAFIQKCTLTIHKRTHTGERSFVCATCGKRWISRDSLAKHMLIHSTEKPFECDRCGRRFNQKPTLKLHYRIHTGKPFSCHICTKRFIKNSNLRRHLKGSHSVQAGD